jgi:hypothetical protein
VLGCVPEFEQLVPVGKGGPSVVVSTCMLVLGCVPEFEQLVPDEGWRSDGTQKALRRHSPKDGQDQKLPCMAQGHLSKRSQLLKRR